MSNIIVPEAPRIWTRRPTIIEPRDPFNYRVQLAGRIRLQTIRPDGTVHLDTGFFHNLITNAGLDLIGSGNAGLGQFVVGTSNTAPANTDTGLVAQVASTTTQQVFTSAANQGAEHYAVVTETKRFSAPGVAHNLQECGVKGGASNATLWSRALILDGVGAPTTLVWAADEALDMTYELRIYPPAADVDTTMDVAGVTYDIRIRQANAGAWQPVTNASMPGIKGGWGFAQGALAYSGAIGAVTGAPAGTSGNDTSDVNSAYVNGNYYRDFTSTWGLTAGNVGGIVSFVVNCGTYSNAGAQTAGMRFQVGILSGGTGSIPKTGSNQLSMNWRHSWARRP
jgi:hypothetical protein